MPLCAAAEPAIRRQDFFKARVVWLRFRRRFFPVASCVLPTAAEGVASVSTSIPASVAGAAVAKAPSAVSTVISGKGEADSTGAVDVDVAVALSARRLRVCRRKEDMCSAVGGAVSAGTGSVSVPRTTLGETEAASPQHAGLLPCPSARPVMIFAGGGRFGAFQFDSMAL